jgi:hypothetical protein
MTTKKILARTALTLSLLASSGLALASTSSGNPTHLNVGLYKTELWNGTQWVAVFDAASPTTVDLVTNAGGAFGQGAIDPGTYSKIRFTVANTVAYQAPAIGGVGGCSASSSSFEIATGAGAKVTLTFATAAAGGATDWYANGSDATPLLMSAPIAVQDGQTTRIALQFQTADTVVCSGTTISVDAPGLAVTSTVVPSLPAFTGGTYWFTHYNSSRGWDAPRGDPSTLTAAQLADLRSRAGYYLGWGGKVVLSAPDANGIGTISFPAGLMEHRRQVNEAGCTDCGIVPAKLPSGPMTYAIDANKRLEIGGNMHGAFNADFTVMVLVGIEGTGEGQDLILSVKQGGAQNLTGTFATATADTEVSFDPTAQTSIASQLYTAQNFGWVAFDPAAVTTQAAIYTSDTSLTSPTLTPGSGFGWNYGTKNISGQLGLPTSLVVGADGTGSMSLNGDNMWIAAAPGGQVGIMAGDTAGTGHIRSPTETRYEQQNFLFLKQGPVGTHTVADLAGTWTIVSRQDESRTLNGAPADFILTKGAQYGSVVWDLSGNLSFDVTKNDDLGVVGSEAGVGTLAMVPGGACIGATAGETQTTADRSAWNESPCRGKKLDLAVLTAGTGAQAKEVAWMVFSEDGKTAVIVDPEGYVTPDWRGNASSDPGHFRMFGYMVKAN